MDAKVLTDEQIDLIANDGCRNAAGGIYATRIYEFARAIEQAVLAALPSDAAQAPWISVKEHVPTEAGTVLAYFRPTTGSAWQVGTVFSNVEGFSSLYPGACSIQVSHWMPMPLAPNAAPVAPAAAAQMPKARRDGAYPEYRNPDELLSTVAQPDERAAFEALENRALQIADELFPIDASPSHGQVSEFVRRILELRATAPQATVKGDERAAWDGDSVESREAFRTYDAREPVRTRSTWQIWRDACAWQAARAAVPQAGATLTDEQIEAFAADARQHEAGEFLGGTKVASHDNVVWAIRRALLAAHPSEKAGARAEGNHAPIDVNHTGDKA